MKRIDAIVSGTPTKSKSREAAIERIQGRIKMSKLNASAEIESIDEKIDKALGRLAKAGEVDDALTELNDLLNEQRDQKEILENAKEIERRLNEDVETEKA